MSLKFNNNKLKNIYIIIKDNLISCLTVNLLAKRNMKINYKNLAKQWTPIMI